MANSNRNRGDGAGGSASLAASRGCLRAWLAYIGDSYGLFPCECIQKRSGEGADGCQCRIGGGCGA